MSGAGVDDRRWRKLRIVAQDPSLTTHGEILTALVRVPFERLEEGPRGHRFHVVDHDISTGKSGPRVVIPDVEGGLPLPRSLTGRRARDFRAQNVYAIAARVLNVFETSLGRRVPWGFDAHHLYLVPEAFEDANAFYAEGDNALYFGYARDASRRVYTALSHDIVTHEVTHAILDGVRDRYDTTPGLPDQGAFHEAFADITALLAAFALPELVDVLLRRAVRRRMIDLTDPRPPGLGRVIGGLAEEIGQYITGDPRAEGIRNSYRLYERPPQLWRRHQEFEEPHRRGEVLVAAVIGSLVEIWARRVARVAEAGNLDEERLAMEGAHAADHLLKMCIRSLDYCPPLEFEFEDFLEALLVSDEEIEPDDKYGYRPALTKAFARFGIGRARWRIMDLALADGPLSYENFNYVRLREDPDEVFHFLWENADRLGLDPRWYTLVEQVRRVMRVAADGFVVEDVMIDYVQQVQGPPADVARILGFTLPGGLPADKDIRVHGGGVVVFDQFGRAKFHERKPIRDPRRQRERLRHLVRSGGDDSQGRYGFSVYYPEGQRFAEAHRPARETSETW